MPTVLRVDGYRLYFYSHEPNEPPHIHIDQGQFSAKFWLSPLALARNMGFRAHELNKLHIIVREHQNFLLEAWHGYFSD